jgi:hypothetical protein
MSPPLEPEMSADEKVARAMTVAAAKARNEAPPIFVAGSPQRSVQQATIADFAAVAAKVGTYDKPLEERPKATNVVEFMKQRADRRIAALKQWKEAR